LVWVGSGGNALTGGRRHRSRRGRR
jgi:hypothetical protein